MDLVRLLYGAVSKASVWLVENWVVSSMVFAALVGFGLALDLVERRCNGRGGF